MNPRNALSILSMVGLPLAVLVSCVTVSLEFEEGSSPEMYFQRAQQAVDRNDFERAQRIYRMFLERNVDDLFYVVSAKYEIAFLDYKMEKIPQAIEGFRQLLRTYYEDPAMEGRVPEWPRVLSRRLLQKLEASPSGG